MGTYLYTGMVSKVEVESIDNLRDYKFLPLELYDIEVGNKYTTLTLKNNIFTKENLLNFLEEQYSKFEVYNKDEIFNDINNIKNTENFIEELKNINYSNLMVVEDISNGYSVEMISYLSDGKFEMESYNNTLNYYLDAIRKSSDNPLIKTINFLIC